MEKVPAQSKWLTSNAERDELERKLRVNLQAKAAELAELLEAVIGHWGYEDPIYRF